MNELKLAAEREKLARVLRCAPEAVDFGDTLDVAAMRRLRNTISAALFDEHRPLFQKLADASKLLPASISAKLSEKVFGPLFSSRISGLLAVDKAISIAEKLHTDFLTDVTVEMDPRSATELLQRMPQAITLAVATELERREEFVTMARFVDALTLDDLLAVADQLDDVSLLRIGFFVEDPARLSEIIGHLPEQRVKRTVELTAGRDAELARAGISLFTSLAPDGREALLRAARRIDTDLADWLRDAAAAAST